MNPLTLYLSPYIDESCLCGYALIFFCEKNKARRDFSQLAFVNPRIAPYKPL